FESKIAFPYPQYISKEQQQEEIDYLEKVQTFIDTEINADWIDRHSEIPAAVIQGLGKLGVLGMSIPKEHGGLGMTQRAYCKVAEAIAGKCGSTALFVNAHQSVGLKALLLFGTPEQQQKWLAPLARGEQLAAFSLTEPNAGSDAAGIETRAEFDKEANVYYITGKKQWTTNGSMAHVLTVMAKTEVETPQGKQDKITAFLVTPDMPGFKVTHASLEKVGMRGSKTSNLAFEHMSVPAANILGPIGGGLKVCLTVLDYGRTTFGATCTGVAKELVKKSIEYSRTRYQFKRPLASFGLVKKKLARMSALLYAMDATTYFTAGLIDSGVEDIMLESAMLKVFSSEAAWLILYDTMQIYGGRSFFTDHPFERVMRDSRLNMIGEGSNEVMRAFIGAVGMRDVGLQLKGYMEILKDPFNQSKNISPMFTHLFSRLQAPSVPVKSAQLESQAQALGKAIRRFGYAVVKLLAHYREGIIENQLELERIAESAMALYTTSAVLSKLDADLQLPGYALNNPYDLDSGKLYCQMAMNTIDQNLNSLFSKDDALIESLSDKLTGIKTVW
ncbi:MAG: acyl-CoA dehydrogenase family protein, partial [Parachlamydiaceae bacterium]|nr:acyl-CoA dehydrogenase family protein [Parachlamydiaceae bacterium]